MPNSDSEFWKNRVLKHWDNLNRLAKKRFADDNAADQAVIYVMEALEDDDWRRVKAYKGQARFNTFLTVIVNRLLEDYARSRYGRFRVPKWISRQGAVWEKIYRLLCEERMSWDDVIEVMSQTAPGGRSKDQVSETAAVILAKTPDCGKQRGDATPVDPNDLERDDFGGALGERLSPEQIVAARQRALLLKTLGQWFKDDDEDDDGPFPDEAVGEYCRRIKAEVSLSSSERLLLRMVFQDGMTVVAAGRMLGWGADKVHGQLRRLLARIRKKFEEAGLDPPLKEILREEEEN